MSLIRQGEGLIRALAGGIGAAANGFAKSSAAKFTETANQVFAQHEASRTFERSAVYADLCAAIPARHARTLIKDYCDRRIAAGLHDVLEDGLLTPEEDAAMQTLIQRYARDGLDDRTVRMIENARIQYAAWGNPLEPIGSSLLLQRGEWSAVEVEAEAMEVRERAVRVSYAGPSARIRLMKGVYYSAGSLGVDRQQRSYIHSMGHGTLNATNKRLLWVSPKRTVSIQLGKIVQIEPYRDGIRIAKDAGKPIVFQFTRDDPLSVAKIGRVIEELR